MDYSKVTLHASELKNTAEFLLEMLEATGLPPAEAWLGLSDSSIIKIIQTIEKVIGLIEESRAVASATQGEVKHVKSTTPGALYTALRSLDTLLREQAHGSVVNRWKAVPEETRVTLHKMIIVALG